MAITGNFERFQHFNYETNFLKNENLFKKLKYFFLFESIKIETATFLHKSALSEVNVKTNRMGSTKWAKSERTEFCQYLIFSLLFFQFKKLL